MSLTFSKTGYSPGGGERPMRSRTFSDLKMVIGTFTFDSTYVTGGETLSASEIGLAEILFMDCVATPSAGTTGRGGTIAVFFRPTTPATTGGATVGQIMAFGMTSGSTVGTIMSELSNQSLSAWSVRFIAFGRK